MNTTNTDSTTVVAATAGRRFLLSSLLVACLAYQPIDAFVTPTTSTTTTISGRYKTMQLPKLQQPPQRQRVQPLFVVADMPNLEGEKEKRKSDNNNSDDDNHDDSDDWVATQNGGFLPRIPQILKKKLGSLTGLSSSSSSTTTEPTRKTNTKPEEVLTIQEYKSIVADEQDQIVCVRFYAPWCKACKAVQQPFRKLCRENPSVKFVEVPLTKENAFLHEGLGIPSLPYGHIYHPNAGLVEERKINLKKKEFATFEQVLKTYLDGECDVDYPEGGLASPWVNSSN